MKAQIPSIYKPIFTDDYTFLTFYGGRGGSKTESVAQSLVLISTQKKVRILCLRESQNSIAESVKAVLEKWIEKLGLSEQFVITATSIRCINGSEFLFSGLKSHSAINLKSITDVNYTWLEEAESFSKKSWQLLVPSVTRTPNAKIISTFNPNRDDDIIYQTFVAKTPPKRSYVRKINCFENPFFKGSQLEQIMLDDKERLPPEEFAHIWEGELVRYTEGSIFKESNLTPKDLDVKVFTKIVIACDPATTDRNTSNEYGIVVLGKLEDGTVGVLDDFSGNMSPHEFANSVALAKNVYNTNNVVVEVNNGGDFIKALLLENDSFLNVKEVRAGTDKLHRALPVANLFATRKIFFNRKFEKLERQMRLMTDRGFIGSRGESPDRLDAMVWGVYELFDIKSKEQLHSLFKPEYFEHRFNTNFMLVEQNRVYATYYKSQFVGIVIDIWREFNEMFVEIKDSFVYSSYKDCEYLNDSNYSVYVEKTALNEFWKECANASVFNSLKTENLKDLALLILPTTKANKVFFAKNVKSRHHKGLLQNILQTELYEFNYENTEKCELFYIFCAMIVRGFGLKEKI